MREARDPKLGAVVIRIPPDTRLTPEGQERRRLAAERGEEGLGLLPMREVQVEDRGRILVFLMGPVETGGRDTLLGEYEI